MPGDDRLARVSVLFSPDVQDVRHATVYLRLEEVGRSDAPSRIVAEQVLRDIAYQRGVPLELELRGAAPPGGGRYQVRIHVDVDGDGQVSPGDYVSTEHYPVIPSGAATQLQVRVHRV